MKKFLKILVCLLACVCSFSFVGCLKHEHKSISSSLVDPTDSELGYTLHTCECGETYKDNFTCLVRFENLSNDTNLPQIDDKIVALNSTFNGVSSTNNYTPIEYRIYKNENYYLNIYKDQPINDCCEIAIVWKDNSISSEAETNFNEVIKKIKKLEEISTQYNIDNNLTSNSQIRTMQYIRQARYATSQWNTFGGTIESNFSEYVEANQDEYDLSSLQTLSNFTIPNTNEKVDFVHMIAIMNVVLLKGLDNNIINDLVGWGGDLCQLVLELKSKNLTDENLTSTAYSLLGNNSSSFSSSDLLADIDAINIAKLYSTFVSNKSISNAIQQYYNSINTNNHRKTEFLINAFPTSIDNNAGDLLQTQSEMSSTILTRLNSSYYIKIWCMQNGLNITNDIDEFTASAMAFANYLFN